MADAADEMLEHPGAGDQAVLRHVPDEDRGEVTRFRGADDRARHRPDLRDPARAPSTFSEAIVCTESRMKSPGLIASSCPSTRPRSVSEARYRFLCNAPIRSARKRTCAALSSPEIYSTVVPDSAVFAATSSRSVDLPTPGSPARRTTAPGTIPPPSTRSNSPTPVG